MPLSLAKSRAIHGILSGKEVAFVCADERNRIEAMREIAANLPVHTQVDRVAHCLMKGSGVIYFLIAEEAYRCVGRRFDHAYSDETVPAEIQWCVVVRQNGEPAS